MANETLPKFTDLKDPMQLKLLNNSLWFLYSKVRGGISARDIVQGVINTVKISKPTLAEDVVPGDCVIFDYNTGKYIKYNGGMGVIDDKKDLVVLGECEYSGIGENVGYNFYADEDGHITADKITDFPIGFARTNKILLVMPRGEWGIPKIYSGQMREFRAMPGPSGRIRVKLWHPNDGDGGMLRISSEGPYDGSGIGWGALVDTFTDDSNYHGFGKWYEITGLTDKTRYYLHYFPRKATLYNDAMNPAHDASCKAGTLIKEYRFENTVGTTLLDTVGGQNGTNTNVSIVQGPVDAEDDAGEYNGSTSSTQLPNNWSDFLSSNCAIEIGIYPENHMGCVLGIMYGSYSSIFTTTSTIKINLNNSDRIEAAIPQQSWSWVLFNRSTVSGMEAFIDNVSKGTNAYTGNDGGLAYGNYIGIFRVGLENTWKGKLAFIRIYNDTVEDYERASLESGGDWW